MNSHEKYLKKQLENPEFAAEWECQQPELECIKALITARLEQNLTQKELSLDQLSGCPETPSTCATGDQSVIGLSCKCTLRKPVMLARGDRSLI